MMPKVSILMNGYNCQKYVKQAIDSVLAQTYSEWEIIFVDNCSTDQTAEIVKSYLNNKIQYIKTDRNIALGFARQVGLEYCKGDFVCFLDTDDLWFPTKLLEQIKCFQVDDQLKMVYSGFDFIDDCCQVIGSYQPIDGEGSLIERQLFRYEINQQTVMIRNDIPLSFDSNKKYSVDFHLFVFLCAKYKVKAISSRLIQYRIHSSNFSHNVNELEWFEQKSTLDELFKAFPKLKSMFPSATKHAYARASYYKARYLVGIGEQERARCIMKSIATVGFFYLSLYLLSLLPKNIWDYTHRKFRRFS